MRGVLKVGLWWLLAVAMPLMAQPAVELTTDGGQPPLLLLERGAERSQAADVRVVVDVSGSMRHNDPDQLAASALELLVALLPRGIHGGIWTFGEFVDNPLPVAPVDAEWRQQALALRPALVDYQMFTDIEAAVREASGDADNGPRHLILLTDGMIDLPADGQNKAARDEASQRRLSDELTPRLAEEGVVIHAVAFSPEADLPLVELLGQRSGGLAALAESPDELLRAFLDIFDRIFPGDRVPLDDGHFTIDDQIESFSALLFHDPDSPPLTLIGPDGQRYSRDDHPDSVRWQSEPRFDLITVPDPAEGEWRVEGPISVDSRISVASTLTLRSAELPATLYQGFEVPIEAWLDLNGEVLASPAWPDDLRLRVELQDLAGNVQAATRLAADDQRFRGVLPAPALTGNARLVIDADSVRFQRQRVQAVNVLPAIAAEVDETVSQVSLRAEHPRLTIDNTQIRAELQGERLDVEPLDERQWRIPLPELPDETRLPLLLSATVTLDDQRLELSLPRLVLNPQARIGVDAAPPDSVGMQAEALEEVPAEEPEAVPEPDLAERLVSAINQLPRQAQALWRDAVPRLERAGEPLGLDAESSLRWAGGLAAALIALLVLGGWSRTRRRPSHREEPHV
ncbi:TIGR03503 family protein [Franzmannia pantelleriensis]|uniref:TIGR03503 family protein n=1 Tax=Franzmannia pantelleriensis TaxID=48727 RepID=A0A1G9K3Q9_9GAMM|nr:vWA domain-containing protein [Halomonas pantelleriensis]SDL44282.1 TIGR03503 family protein [Halomonas pantelleriensis]